MSEDPHSPLGPDDLAEITAYLRARWADERSNTFAYDGTYNDADHCWGLHNAPADVLADLDAKEDLLTDLLAEQHTICMDDYWYTCCAATEERDGGHCPGDDHNHQNACTCGLTTLTARRLRILAAPYAARPDFKETWRR